MRLDQALLVQESFEALHPNADALAASFFERLIAIDPNVGRLFKSSARSSAPASMQMLGYIVRNLHRPMTLVALIRELGVRYGQDGVEDDHYDLAGAALLWTLLDHFGAEYTADLEGAWLAAFRFLTDEMRAAAYGEEAQICVAARDAVLLARPLSGCDSGNMRLSGCVPDPVA